MYLIHHTTWGIYAVHVIYDNMIYNTSVLCFLNVRGKYFYRIQIWRGIYITWFILEVDFYFKRKAFQILSWLIPQFSSPSED